MCTALIITNSENSFFIAGNRDEQRHRTKAKPPEKFDIKGGYALYPVDSQAGGTWIGANSYGLGATLLNGYQDDAAFTPNAPLLSRGILIPDLLKTKNIEEAKLKLKSYDSKLPQIRPFTLIVVQAIDQKIKAFKALWNGHHLDISQIKLPVVFVSSGVEPQKASKIRAHTLAPLLKEGQNINEESIRKYFQSHEPARGPFSVCMHREDAKTVSHTTLKISPESVECVYFDGPLCQTPSLYRIRLKNMVSHHA